MSPADSAGAPGYGDGQGEAKKENEPQRYR